MKRKTISLKILFFLFIVFVGLSSCQNKDLIELAENGQSEYSIIISKNADSLSRLAASEFKKYFFQVTGHELNIKDDSSDPTDLEIIIGECNRIPDLKTALSELNEDGFIIKTNEKKLIIAGGVEKGTLYGVYTFLEDHLNIRKYSDEVMVIPQITTVRIESLDINQNPAFDFRELHMPLARRSISYRDWHKLDLKEGKNEWGMFVHTFDDFIPVDKYFKDHPEYFSYLNVSRIPDGQLCLSNPDVFNIVLDGLRERMAEKPEALYWSVSQNDTYKPCECEDCKLEYNQYGGYSGAMVNFVNNVAAEFPDKVISTLAYQYTRSAPDNIQPADNVNIMFCSIECNRSKPLVSDPSSESFRKDTEDWCKLTSNIFMWDYVVQFRNLLSPFPNLRVLQPNIQYFRDQGMQMMFQQGSGGLMSEFVELRSYIIAKLLWNPDVNVNEVIEDFCLGYYGPAAEYVLEYINTMHDKLEERDGSLGIYGYPYDGIKTYLTPELIKEYEKIFDKAEMAVQDFPDYLQRIKIARLPLEFAILDISLRNVNEDLTYFKTVKDKTIVREDMLERLHKFTDLAKKAGVARYWEHGNYPDDYMNTIEHYVRSSMQPHLALQKPVELKTESSEKYPVGEGVALTDGLKGINDYHFNWLGFEGPDMIAVIDLEEEMVFSKFVSDYLQEIKSWVFLPDEVEYYYSTDGKEFILAGSVKNTVPEKRTGTFIQSFELKVNPTNARYIKVIAKNKGLCPDWHPGATYPAWIFCDEVMVIGNGL